MEAGESRFNFGLFLPWFMADGLRVFDDPAWCFRVIWPPQVKDDAISLRGGLGNLFGLLGRAIEHLDPACGDLNSVVMVKLVPGCKRHVWPAHGFGDEVFDLFQKRLGIRGLVNH